MRPAVVGQKNFIAVRIVVVIVRRRMRNVKTYCRVPPADEHAAATDAGVVVD